MKHRSPWLIQRVAAFALLAAAALISQTPGPRPLTKPLKCPQGDCPLLAGAPETSGMRSGFVRLAPGETVGWHSTAQNEETLVVLHGSGAALIDGQGQQNFTAPAMAYIPRATRHNVRNTGTDTLEYVYVVAPATPVK
jgi:mannose-6-phosphate isomerase-like protein (cupin superfamily)